MTVAVWAWLYHSKLVCLMIKRESLMFSLRQYCLDFPIFTMIDCKFHFSYTRGDKILDLVLTNLRECYKDPIQRPPHGLSNHMTIEVQPKDRSQLPDSRSKIKTRDLKPSNRLAIRTYLQEVDAYTLVGNVHGCAEKVSIFQSIIQHGLDSVLPLRSKAIHSRDPPWINSGLKDLIRRR